MIETLMSESVVKLSALFFGVIVGIYASGGDIDMILDLLKTKNRKKK